MAEPRVMSTPTRKLNDPVGVALRRCDATLLATLQGGVACLTYLLVAHAPSIPINMYGVSKR